MLTQVAMKDCVGKTITAVRETLAYDPALVIVFADGTFCQIEAGIRYDSAELNDSTRVEAADCNSDHVAAGVATEAEVAEARAAKQREIASTNAARERREFERLRAKYGS